MVLRSCRVCEPDRVSLTVTRDAKPALGSPSSIPGLCRLVRLLEFMQCALARACEVMAGGETSVDFGRSRYVHRDGAKSKVKGFPSTNSRANSNRFNDSSSQSHRHGRMRPGE